MNTTTAPSAARFGLQEADRVGVAASVLCAIHCALAPVLLIALPTFGQVWAHPASHILVALFVVPLAAFSIRKGYRTHGKRWIVGTAAIGILFVLGGAALPAFSKGNVETSQAVEVASSEEGASESVVSEEAVSCDGSACEAGASEGESVVSEEAVGCDGSACEAGASEAEPAVCVDACCPSLQVTETGETKLHIPPAAIVTTLGGVFLIVAHVGNLCSCGHACRASVCTDC